jgi:hypothetical protein
MRRVLRTACCCADGSCFLCSPIDPAYVLLALLDKRKQQEQQVRCWLHQQGERSRTLQPSQGAGPSDVTAQPWMHLTACMRQGRSPLFYRAASIAGLWR